MKRGGRLRHKSRTNSNPWINEPLRRRFMRRHGNRCWLQGWLKHKCGGDLDPHHIHFVGMIRWDVFGNLIPICRVAHSWIHPPPGRKHAGNRIDGTVLCMAARIERKRRATRERIREDWRLALGRDAVTAWLEVRRDQGKIGDVAMEACEFVLSQF